MRFSTFRDAGILVMAAAITTAVIDELRPTRPVTDTASPSNLKDPVAKGCASRYGQLYSMGCDYSGEAKVSYTRPASRDEWRASLIAADLSGSPVFGVLSTPDPKTQARSTRIFLPGQQAWADALGWRLRADVAYFQVVGGPVEDPEPELIAVDPTLIEQDDATASASPADAAGAADTVAEAH